MQLGQSGLGGTGAAGGAGQQRSGFIGRDDNANRFVGSSGAGAQGGAGQQGRNGLNQRNQMNRNQQGQNRNRGNAQNQQFMNQGNQNFGGGSGQQQQRTIRPRQKVAFTYPATSQTKLQTALNTRFDKLAKRAGFEGVQIVADGDKVTLRGQVDTEDTRKLAAMLASIEPGVSSVTNELTVQTPEPPEPGE
jgi:osmotically-inducible protein OsmY